MRKRAAKDDSVLRLDVPHQFPLTGRRQSHAVNRYPSNSYVTVMTYTTRPDEMPNVAEGKRGGDGVRISVADLSK
jgi:hypothetical protein